MLRHSLNVFGQFFALILAVAFLNCGQAQARDTELLNKAVTDSVQERAGVDAEFKTNHAAAKAEELPHGKAHPIALVLGDELGGTHVASDRLKVHAQPHSYSEQAVAVKLDKEWKEVNKSVKRASHEVQDQPERTLNKKPLTEEEEF